MSNHAQPLFVLMVYNFQLFLTYVPQHENQTDIPYYYINTNEIYS